MPKTRRTQHIVVYTQECSETQLHTAKVSQSAKALGFSQFLWMRHVWKDLILFFCDDQVHRIGCNFPLWNPVIFGILVTFWFSYRNCTLIAAPFATQDRLLEIPTNAHQTK